jgi:hypothetical protein
MPLTNGMVLFAVRILFTELIIELKKAACARFCFFYLFLGFLLHKHHSSTVSVDQLANVTLPA